MAAGSLGDRRHEVLQGHVDQRRVLDGVHSCGIEGDVHSPGRSDHVVGGSLDGISVVDVDLGGLRRPSADEIWSAIALTFRERAPGRNSSAPSPPNARATAPPNDPAAP
jgi:hypothetical protein